MRFSIWPSAAQSWSDVLEVVRHAETTGWDRAYVADHFMGNGETADDESLSPMLEGTAALAALAGATERIGLASLVFGVTYRHPAVLAKWAATVDHVSGGRFVLGLGAGWQLNEHTQYHIELGPPGARIDRLVEALAALRGLLSERETTFDGEYFQLTRALAEPKPVQSRLPVLIGGKGDRMLGVVARHADEWNMWSVPETIAERRQALGRACERVGRDPATIATSTQALWFIDRDAPESAGPPAIGGSLDRLGEYVAAWRDAGVDEVIVPDFTLGSGAARIEAMDAVVERLAPAFR